ncbi:hypothetical protein J3R83DRAFT_14080 [Lanmaoa asiatica]|nr:hypothetical protein J3R83DRAFT_14080 [Lanmaoa asiatica]
MSDTPAESPAQLFAEKAWLAGALITGIGYGVVMALFWLCFQALWNRLKRKDASYRRNLFFLLYVCIQFTFGSLFLGSNSQFTQLAFINYRGFPGGPSAYEKQMFSITVDEIGNVSYVLANWLADSLLVWRCVIIYRDFGALSWRIVLAITGLMQLASYVLGVFFLLQISSPASSPYINAGHPINWTIPYFCVSLAINIVVTLLIVIRLLLYRRAMVQLLGPGHATECTTVVAMLVESAAVYATFSLLFLIPFAMNNPVSYTFIQVLGEAQLIAPLLIIYREAQGKGWISIVSSVNLVDRQWWWRYSYRTVHRHSIRAGMRTLDLPSKQDSFGQVVAEVEVEVEVRKGGREEHELREL